ncbi:hypothetical protein Bca52824_035300 [Brassica carinata]|uniref:Uncharacterized protein n=1 Tax=Brassica carinata TaxID=52824 RepID=A0A8X7S2Y8_BRACI|nr:hypothetical protein Bca52824_035300 [Brassica carinata]
MLLFCLRNLKVAAHNVAILGLVESIKILAEKIEDIDVSVADKVSKTLEATSDAKVEARVGWEKSVNCRAVLEALASTLEEPTRRCKPQLTKTQVWPYVGNSTVKRIITGEKVSKEPYDPLAKVEAEKLQKVLDFIKSDLDAKDPGAGDDSIGFFLKLMIPTNKRLQLNIKLRLVADCELFHVLAYCSSNAYVSQTLQARTVSVFLFLNCISVSLVCELMGERLQELGPEHE